MLPNQTIAGVDGCRGGWIAVFQQGDLIEAKVFPTFLGLLEALPDAVVAVDMPIGLPNLGTIGGREPERAARSAVGRTTRSSLFPIPSRSAVYAECDDLIGMGNILSAFGRAQPVAKRTSEPPTGFSIQAFMIFPKIREIDRLLRESPMLVERVFESHPEMAFWRMNGKRDLENRKKRKRRMWEPGMQERRQLLVRQGFDADWLRSALALASRERPKGIAFGEDDFLDACAMFTVARRLIEHRAESFPASPGRDGENLPVAIWV